VFQAPGVEPFFVGPDSQRQVIDYAKTRQGFSRGEIRVHNSAQGDCRNDPVRRQRKEVLVRFIKAFRATVLNIRPWDMIRVKKNII
jgi:hypothetical protein